MDTSVKSDAGERSLGRATRRMRTLEEKQAIVEEASQPGISVAQVARKHGVNANLVFGWLRLHQRGVLTAQRQRKSVPLLAVKIATPTLTPSERASPLAQNTGARAEQSAPESHAMLELVLQDGVRVRLYGEAQRTLLDHILKRLSLP